MGWLLAIVLKPFVAVVMIFVAVCVAMLVHRWLPDGKLKRILFSPLPGHRGKADRWC